MSPSHERLERRTTRTTRTIRTTRTVRTISAPASAGYRLLAADFHTHSSTWSDGSLTPWGLVIEAWYQGLDALAITGHRQTQDARWGRWFSEKIGGPIVLVGEEIPEIPQHVTDAHSSSRSSRGVPMRRGSARPTSRDRDAEADGRLRTMASTEYPMPVLDRLSQILGIAGFALLVITRLR